MLVVVLYPEEIYLQSLPGSQDLRPHEPTSGSGERRASTAFSVFSSPFFDRINIFFFGIFIGEHELNLCNYYIIFVSLVMAAHVHRTARDSGVFSTLWVCRGVGEIKRVQRVILIEIYLTFNCVFCFLVYLALSQ